MEIYLLKSAACLGAFLIFYKLFLENEIMHTFKRFYLLGMVAISFLIPLVTFTTYAEANSTINPLAITNSFGTNSDGITFLELLPYILWTVYVIGFVFFSFRFGKNLISLFLKIKRNPKFKVITHVNVLLQDKVNPHTFFKYIFLNKSNYDAKKIPEEVLLHEQTHATQKHSIDILFIEVLQIIFWFNPLIYLIKNSIKLNHEFLADEAVLSKGIESSHYQKLLLVFSSNTPSPILANSINYSLIKKRFTVMKTQTSKSKIWFRSILLLPLLAILIFSFSSTKEIEKESSELIENYVQEGATKAQVNEYNSLAQKYNNMDESNMRIKKSDVERLKYLYNLMTKKQRKNAAPFPNFPPPPPSPDKASEPMRVVVGVNDTGANVPPPPPKAPKVPKAPKMKTKNKEEKVKKEEEKLVLQRVMLEKRNQEREAERLVLVDNRKVEREKMKTLKYEEASNQRVAMRLETNKERLQKREVQLKKRQINQEQKKNAVYRRQVEQKKVSLKEENKK